MDHDVAIAGAGPAGLVTAERIARAGFKTVVFEKNAEIGTPVRTSGGSWVSTMRELNVPASLYHPIHHMRLLMRGAEAHFDYADPLPCVLDVRNFYQYLAERATAAGASVVLDSSVERPVLKGTTFVGLRVRVPTAGTVEVAAKVLVDASGYNSILSKRGGIHPGFQEFGLGVEYDLLAPHFNEDETMLFFGDDVAPSGYAWAFPYGGQRVRVGVGVPRPPKNVDPLEYLERLPKFIPAIGRALTGSRVVEVHRGLIPFLSPLRAPLVADGLIIVGDAAGQNSTLAGEGIRYAMDAGRMAGDVIVMALANRDYSKKYLERYEFRWQKAFGLNLWMAFWLHKRMMNFTDDDWARALALFQRLSPRQFAALLRNDFSLPWLLDLLLHKLPLFPPALRFMLQPRPARR